MTSIVKYGLYYIKTTLFVYNYKLQYLIQRTPIVHHFSLFAVGTKPYLCFKIAHAKCAILLDMV